MKKTYAINGGAGRVICALPALEKLAETTSDFYILSEGWLEFYLGIPLLQDKVLDVNMKGLFETYLKDTEIVSPEPYRVWQYYNQQMNIAQAYNYLINGIEDSGVLKPRLVLNKEEEYLGARVVADAKKQHKKNITIVIQPFGASCQHLEENVCIDNSSRSIEPYVYIEMVKHLVKKYNVILMSTFRLKEDIYSFQPDIKELRKWIGVISEADYFIGCDSVGQHMAYSMDKPGTVILGSSFKENVLLNPQYFQVIEREGCTKRYSPIRIAGFASHEADRLNDKLMDFNHDEVSKILNLIDSHISKTVTIK